MLSPQELIKDDFSRTIRGYSPEEVDAHIAYMIEKYSELYSANDELERRLRVALSEIDGFKQDEKSVRTALVNAQKASAAILSEASGKSDAIIENAKNTCSDILSEFDRELAIKRDELFRLKKEVELFKKKLFEEYHEHIASLEKVSLEEGSEFLNFDLPDGYFDRKARDEIEEKASDIVPGGVFEIPKTEDGEKAGESRDKKAVSESSASDDDDEEIFAVEGVIAGISDIPVKEESGDDIVFNMTKDEEKKEFTFDSMTDPDAPKSDILGGEEVFKRAEEEPAREDEKDLSASCEPDGNEADDKISAEDTLDLTRTPLGGEMGSVKDTIKALNRKLREEENGIKMPDTAPEKSAEDDEFIRLIKSVTSNAESKRKSELDKVYSQGKGRKTDEKLSLTEEFDLVYNKNNK